MIKLSLFVVRMKRLHYCSLSSLVTLLLLTGNILASSSSNQMEKMNLPKAADRIKNEQQSVWVEFIQLALDAKPLNLGQGFPDFAAPKYLLDSLQDASTNQSNPDSINNNQYTRSFGHPRLIKALQNYYKYFRGFDELLGPKEQILVTVGAYEALFTSIMAFVNPGDEVLIIEPAFDAYAPIVSMAQGKSVYVPLRLTSTKNIANNHSSRLSSADFFIDMKEFESKITNKTRLLVLNTPNNPLGKMYSSNELEQIAEMCRRYNILVIADEVYEQMYYSPNEHLSIAKLPGMWERTITIGSAGKTFSVTGWKIGWALGPKELIRYVQLIHQTAIYTVATPLQEAIARALEHELSLLRANKPTYWDELRADLVIKRDRMAKILEQADMRPILPEGGYFMLADFSQLAKRFPEYLELGQVKSSTEGEPVNTNDYRFVRWLSREKKLQGIPAGAFYSSPNKHLADNLMRFCFIKQEATLDALERILAENLHLKPQIAKSNL